MSEIRTGIGPDGTFSIDLEQEFITLDIAEWLRCIKDAQSANASFNAPGNMLLNRTYIRYVDAEGNVCEWGEIVDGNPYGIPEGGTIPLTPASGALPPQDEAVAADETLIAEFSVTLDDEIIISLTELVPVAASSFLDLLRPGADTNALYAALVALLDDDTTATGSTGSDGLEVGAGNDSVEARTGDDTVYKWKPGDLVYDGGDGSDTLSFQAALGNAYPTPFTQPLVVNLAAGTGQSPYGGTLTLASVENIVGTSQADSITGSDGPNVIGDGIADAGADTIAALGGDDVVLLAPFNGSVTADGGAGTDELSFTIEDGTIDIANVVLDLLTPALNTGPLAGGDFENFEKYTAATLIAVGGDIFVFGGTESGEFVRGQNGTLLNNQAVAFEDLLSGRGGNDTMSGERGRDSLDGGAGSDSLDGGVDNDSLRGGAGNDTILGGLGTDRAIFAGASGAYTVETGVRGVIVSGPDGSDEVSGVEQLQFDDGPQETPAIVFVENASLVEGTTRFMLFTIAVSRDVTQAVTVTATTSNGTALAGFDYIAKIDVTVTIPAGQGSTTFGVDIFTDPLFEGDETFTLTLSNPMNAQLGTQPFATGTIIDDDEEPPPVEVDQTITGGAASELIFGSALRDLIQGNGGADTVFAGDANDVIEGGADRDFLVAEGGADTGRGGDGDDVLFGGSGADSLLGEADVDFLFGESGANTLDGGAGNDRIHINREDAIAAGGEGVFDVLVVLDSAGPLSINLGNAANQNTTGSGPVITGIEAVDASLSNQPVNVTGAVLNGFGNVLFTSGFNDTVTGSSAIDIILGGGGNDILNGGGGNDTLIADAGSDTLTGGAGADDFFHPGAGSSMRVADFAPGSDQVVLLASSGLTAQQALAASTQQGADAVLALPNSGGTIILAGVQVAALGAADFEVV